VNIPRTFDLNPGVVSKLKTPLLALAVLGWVASIIGWALEPTRTQFYFSYLVAFVYFVSLSIGALFFVMIQHLTGAGWSVVVRRLAETVMTNMWVLAPLFIPLMIGMFSHAPEMHSYYEWRDAALVEQDALLKAKKGYLNLPFFFVRAAIYLIIWCLFSWALYRCSIRQDADGNPEWTRRAAKWSAPGVPLLILSATFAAFDWLMSLAPHWYSTIFGVYFFSGSGVAFIALLIVLAVWLRSNNVLSDVITVEHYHDLGKLLFAFNVFWTYIAFSQYFLIWYANLPEETVWFKDRQVGSWLFVSLLIVFGHFVLPFIALLTRAAKRHPVALPAVAGWMLFIQYVDIYWMAMPVLHKAGLRIHWLDAATLLAVGGTVGFFFLKRLASHSVIPVRDPYLGESLEFENA
jgi:hypothetical protein